MEKTKAELGQELLTAWLTTSMIIRGNRFLQNLTFNQTLVCGFLRDNVERGGNGMTAAELCAVTGLLKSQMSKVLGQLDERHLLSKTEDPRDARRILLTLAPTEDGSSTVYDQEHQQVIRVACSIVDHLGVEETQALTRYLNMAGAAAREAMED